MKLISLYASLGILAFSQNILASTEDSDIGHPIHTGDSTESITITGRDVNLVGEAVSASQGIVGQEEIAIRPLLRTGEILELIPGMVVTQHSGTGKANQYFLRGFNLDHGTDFSTFVDHMPVNMRTHGHGQGYTDLNFIIPETIRTLSYKKGAYYADVGDFSGAGSSHIHINTKVNQGTAELTFGENNYARLVALDSIESESGDWLFALELNTNDGPWVDIKENLKKANLLVKHSKKLGSGDLSLTFMGYDASWNSADQIPLRAVENGIVDELGSLDDTLGGESSRYSLSALWQNDTFKFSAYAINYDMDIWSNFTYFLDDEINGDQFEQVDKRWIFGGDFSYAHHSKLNDSPMTNTFGAELRIDKIDEVGLYKTKARQRLGTINEDRVDESSIGLYWQNQFEWTESVRTVLGARYDFYDFDVKSLVNENINGVDLRSNSGTAHEGLLSFKGSLIYTLSDEWETYVSMGEGFHSNDARGTVIRVDPSDGNNVEQVNPLVPSLGYEIGIRGMLMDKLNTSIALWQLELDSELLFVGDAGNTEPSRGSKRKGVEITAYYRVDDNWTLDLEYALTDAKFKDNAPEGNYIPGAIEQVVQTGISGQFDNGWSGALRARYFGGRPLIEDNSVVSDSSTIFNLRVGYQFNDWKVKADVINLFDSKDHDITYLYESRLNSEPTGVGVEDIHYHVLEPRTVRVSFAYSF